MLDVIATIFLLIFVVWSYFALRQTGQRLEDPTDQTVVALEDLAEVCRLAPDGVYVLFTVRQSGNDHQARRVFDTAEDAIAAGVTTFKRSGIPFVQVVQNSAERFEFERPFHDHRGRAEGKKVGSIEIVRVDP
jgi:hypothetical protein